MGSPIFNQNGLVVAAKTDIFKGPRLEFNSSGGELSQSQIDQLIKSLQAYLNEMKRMKICLECNAPEPGHLIGCRQMGFGWAIECPDQAQRSFTVFNTPTKRR